MNKYSVLNQSIAEHGLFLLIDTNVDETFKTPGGSNYFPIVSDGLTVGVTVIYL